jgi:hypothetical protein
MQREVMTFLEQGGPVPVIAHPEPLELRAFRTQGRAVQASARPLAVKATEPRAKRAPALTMSLPKVSEKSSPPAVEPPKPAPAPALRGGYPVDITILPDRADDPFAAFVPADFAPPPVETVVPTAEHSLSDEMNLAQYAAICAELEFFPENAELIFIKYGVLNEERRSWIDREWQARLATRTETFAEYRQLHQHFREHFSSLKRLAPLAPRVDAGARPAPAAPAETAFAADGHAPGFEARPPPSGPQSAGTPRFTDDGTMLLDGAFDPHAPPAPSARPAAAAEPTNLPSLTLEQYATVLADVFVNGQARFAAHGLGDPAVRAAVQKSWNRRLGEEMKVSERFDALYDAARERFRREKQGG